MIISYHISYIISSYLHLVSYFQFSQEVTSLLRLLSLHRENCQQNNLRLCQENGKVFCHIIPHGRKRIADHFVFFLNLEGFNNRNIQNHEKSSTSTSAKHQKKYSHLQSDLPSHLDVQHSCLFARHQSLSDRPIVCHFSRAFSPTRHRFGTSRLAGALGRLLLSRFVCKDEGKFPDVFQSLAKFGIYPRRVISRILFKTQDFDATDAKHYKTYQTFSNSSCSRQVEITFERNFEPSDSARFKIVFYPNALKGMAPWLLKNAWLRSDMWYFLPVHGAGGICEQIFGHEKFLFSSSLFDGVARHAGRWLTNFKKCW